MISLIYAYIFDVGGELRDTEVALQKTLNFGRYEKESLSDIYSDHFNRQGNIPQRILIQTESITIGGMKAELKKYAKIYVFGAILIERFVVLQNPPDSESLRKIIWNPEYSNRLTNLNFSLQAVEEFRRIKEVLKDCFTHEYSQKEFTPDYFIIIQDSQNSRTDREIASILLNELPESLSEHTVKALSQGFPPYYQDDYFAIANDICYFRLRSLAGNIINLIELSFVQLYELKIYDQLLDDFSDRCYEALDLIQLPVSILRFNIFSRSDQRSTKRIFELMKLNVDLIDVVQNITNSTKVTDDYYYSSFYRFMLNEIRFHEWQEKVYSKLNEIRDVDNMVLERIDVVRSTTLEFWVVILILIEIFMGLFKEHWISLDYLKHLAGFFWKL